MFEQFQAWGGDDNHLDSFDHFASVLATPVSQTSSSRAITNAGDDIESAIHTLRSIPESAQVSSACKPSFQGELEMQSALEFSFTRVWSKFWVEVKGFVMSYRNSPSDPEPLEGFPVAFIIDPRDYVEESSTYAADQGMLPDIFQFEKNGNGDFSVRELHENILNIVTKTQVVMCRFQTFAAKQAFIGSVQKNLQEGFGAECWQAKLDAAERAQTTIRKHIFLQYYRMRCVKQSLEAAGMISAVTSMLGSDSKKFQGLVSVDDNINGVASKPTPYFMVLRDHTLDWFRSSSSPSPESFVPLMVASIRFDDDRIRKGQWSFILETPVRSLTITTRHAIALCEWISAIREVIGDSVGDDVQSKSGRVRHRRTSSAFSKMWKHIYVARSHNTPEEPLIKDNFNDSNLPDDNFLHDISGDLQHVIDMRIQGYTLADVMSRKSGIHGFSKLLTKFEDRNMLRCLSELRGAFPLSGADGRRRVEQLITQEIADKISPTIRSRLASQDEPDKFTEAVAELEKELSAYFERILNSVRESKEFRCFVQEQMNISGSTELSFENESMHLALIVTLKGEQPQTIFLDPDKSTVTVGRDPSNDVVIADKRVSRSHIRLTYSKEHMELHDLGSSSGVQVNGSKVKYCSLQPGDVVSIGTTEILFALREPTPKRGVRALLQIFQRFGRNRPEIDHQKE